MTPELTYLLWSVILTFVLIMIPAGDALLKNGLTIQGGSRDNVPEPSVFNKRAQRLRDNMLENMVLFAPLVLIANAADISSMLTITGAKIFFFARMAHAIVYLAGWPMIRPLIWFVSVIGMGMVGFALL